MKYYKFADLSEFLMTQRLLYLSSMTSQESPVTKDTKIYSRKTYYFGYTRQVLRFLVNTHPELVKLILKCSCIGQKSHSVP